MRARAELMPTGGLDRAAAKEPSLFAVALIFWAAFAAAVVAARVMNPGLFESQDPDSFLRLANVRDLIAGQNWFDLVQHRMDPPNGALLQWSRLIDAPLAFLVLVGRALGLGDNLALTGWPALLLLGLMGGAAAIGARLGGRTAGVLSLVLVLLFIDPLVVYLPGDIDHHNAQIAVMTATVAFALRLSGGPLFGVLAGIGCALTLAIGLEMLPHVVILAAAIALRFAWSGKDGRAVAAFGGTIGALPAALYFLTGSPAAAMACDSLSWAFAVPAFIGGVGLAALALLSNEGLGRGGRLVGLGFVALAATGFFIGVTPECLGGPYGQLSPEVKTAFLDTVSEAQPIWVYGAREPIGAVGSLGPLLLALFVAFRHARRRPDLWVLPGCLLFLAILLSCYQVRTLPFASALAIPVLAVWLSELWVRSVQHTGRLRRAMPIVAGFIVAIPFTWMLVGWGGEKAVAAATHGRVVPVVQPKADPALTKNLSEAEQNCFDPSSAALLAQVPRGLVMSPLFYGPTVLVLSAHDVVAGPYHRNGRAILDAIKTAEGSPADAKAILDARGVDYVVVCSLSQESAIAAHKAPDGLVGRLLSGRTPAWLLPVPAKEKTALELWRVVH